MIPSTGKTWIIGPFRAVIIKGDPQFCEDDKVVIGRPGRHQGAKQTLEVELGRDVDTRQLQGSIWQWSMPSKDLMLLTEILRACSVEQNRISMELDALEQTYVSRIICRAGDDLQNARIILSRFQQLPLGSERQEKAEELARLIDDAIDNLRKYVDGLVTGGVKVR